jgi:hypothetical protein
MDKQINNMFVFHIYPFDRLIDIVSEKSSIVKNKTSHI